MRRATFYLLPPNFFGDVLRLINLRLSSKGGVALVIATLCRLFPQSTRTIGAARTGIFPVLC